MLESTATSASGGRQWGAHQDSSSGAALGHAAARGWQGRGLRKGPRGQDRPVDRLPGQKGTPKGSRRHLAQACQERKGLRYQVRARTVRALHSWTGDTLSSGPTSLHYNNPLIAGTLLCKAHCRGSVRILSHSGRAPEPGRRGVSTSRRPPALSVLRHFSRFAPLL